VVYANYGRLEDFDRLAAQHIDLHGKIVICRYGANFRGVKVYIAEKRGAAGVLIYSDPQDDGYYKGDPWPIGPWRPDTGVQRGSVQYLFKYAGDPETPAWLQRWICLTQPASPAAETSRRSSPSPSATTMPHPFCRLCKGRACRRAGRVRFPSAIISARRREGSPGFAAGLPAPDHLGCNRQDQGFGISGRAGVVGNHRDAWVYGTVDPSSGTAAMLESVHGVGALLKDGWRPKRTIVFCSGMLKRRLDRVNGVGGAAGQDARPCRGVLQRGRSSLGSGFLGLRRAFAETVSPRSDPLRSQPVSERFISSGE